jgi:predicted DNA-binding transcriptional regulator AlpA
MKQYSTREAAKKLGMDISSIQRYIKAGKIPVPPLQKLGGGKFRVWTEAEIEHLRQLLPKIANGRKTRYKKQNAQPRAAVPHKSRKPKKK